MGIGAAPFCGAGQEVARVVDLRRLLTKAALILSSVDKRLTSDSASTCRPIATRNAPANVIARVDAVKRCDVRSIVWSNQLLILATKSLSAR